MSSPLFRPTSATEVRERLIAARALEAERRAELVAEIDESAGEMPGDERRNAIALKREIGKQVLSLCAVESLCDSIKETNERHAFRVQAFGYAHALRLLAAAEKEALQSAFGV